MRGAFAVITVWVLLVSTCGGCASQVLVRPDASVEELARAATVYVGSGCVEGGGLVGRGGSGVALDEHRVLTALHVLPCSDPSIVVDRQPATLLMAWPEHDLALLYRSAPMPSVRAPEVAPPTKGTGMVCLSAAAPSRSWRCGRVTAVVGDRVEYTINSVRGNSGAGVYDARGHLIGIHTNLYLQRRGGFGRVLLLPTVNL